MEEQIQQNAGQAAIELLGGLVDRETIKEIVDVSKANEGNKGNGGEDGGGDPKKPEGANNQNNDANIQNGNEGGNEGGEVEDEDGNEGGGDGADNKVVDEKIPDNKFGIKIKKDKEKAPKQVTIEKFDDIPTVLKSKYGHEVKEAKDLSKFFDTADKWRKDSQELAKVSKEVETIKKEKDNAIAVFENLPSELLEAVKAHYNGEDYKKVILESKGLDFKKETHSTKDLVNYYFPNEFTDEDFENPDLRELKIAEKAAIDKYKSDKAARELRAKEQVEKAQLKTKAYQASVNSSVDHLKSSFPDMTPDVIEDIKSTLSSGSLFGEFYNQDGTLKPNAAEMLALAKHGKDFISQLIEIAQRQGESAANEELLDRANKTPRSRNSKGTEVPRKEVTDMVNDLLPDAVVSKRTF